MTLLRLALLLTLAWPALAQERVRLATYNVGLDRDGPGLLLKDILDKDADILAVSQIIGETRPDILLLTSFDNDYQNLAITHFTSLLRAEAGLNYPHIYAPLGNAGLRSGLDINGNGRADDWADNWGFGRFEGGKSMVLLSRFPIAPASRRFDQLKWQDFGPAPQTAGGTAFYASGLWPQLRLASHSLWDVEITLPSGSLHILASHPTPTVFDGEEDANGLRNEAEIAFLTRYLAGEPFTDDSGSTTSLPQGPVVLLADLNADPFDGDSLKTALAALLSHPRLQDPTPTSEGALAAANPSHKGPAARDTADWDDESSGNLRVDYVLPGVGLDVLDAGVFWPLDLTLLDAAKTSHRLVWVDITLP